jgi:hypothetical protein
MNASIRGGDCQEQELTKVLMIDLQDQDVAGTSIFSFYDSYSH